MPPPLQGWSWGREELRHSALPREPLTPEEEALQAKRDAQFLVATVVVLGLLFLWGLVWLLWNFVLPHLGVLAAFITLFAQNPILAGGANILQYLTFLIAFIVWVKAYFKKKQAHINKPEA
jgi:hypothetical protein